MAVRKYPYYPAFDGKKTQPGTQKFIELCAARFKTKSLGAYSNRLMRNSHTEGKKIGDPGMDKWLSVHATGAAVDLQYPDAETRVAMWKWFIAHTKELGICEIHDYAFDKDKADKKVGYGRGYRCSRGENLAGVKEFTEQDNAGSFGGKWFHFELEPELAKDAAKMEAAWNAVPYP